MRRLDKEITNQDVLSEILNKSEICRLGFVDNGEAYIVPVNFAYADGVIYIHSAHEGRKMDLLKKNNHVAFEMEYFHEIVTGPKACNWTTRYRSVMGKGSICINNDIEVKKKGLDLIMKKYGAEIDLVYDEKILSRMTILILTIQSVTGKQSGDWK